MDGAAGPAAGRIRVPGDDGAGVPLLVSSAGGLRLEVVHDEARTRITLHHSWRTAGALVGALHGLLGLFAVSILAATAVVGFATGEDVALTILIAALCVGIGADAAMRAIPGSLLLLGGREIVEARGPRVVVELVSAIRDRRCSWDMGDGALTLVGGARSRYAALCENGYVTPLVGRTGGLGLANEDGEIVLRFGAFVGRGTGLRLVDGLRPDDTGAARQVEAGWARRS